MKKLTSSIDYLILGLAALTASTGHTDLAILGIVIHLTYNKISKES